MNGITAAEVNVVRHAGGIPVCASEMRSRVLWPLMKTPRGKQDKRGFEERSIDSNAAISEKMLLENTAKLLPVRFTSRSCGMSENRVSGSSVTPDRDKSTRRVPKQQPAQVIGVTAVLQQLDAELHSAIDCNGEAETDADTDGKPTVAATLGVTERLAVTDSDTDGKDADRDSAAVTNTEADADGDAD